MPDRVETTFDLAIAYQYFLSLDPVSGVLNEIASEQLRSRVPKALLHSATSLCSVVVQLLSLDNN